MTSQTGKQIFTVYILLNISRSKINQAIKFDQSIEHNNKYFSQKTMPKMWWRN